MLQKFVPTRHPNWILLAIGFLIVLGLVDANLPASPVGAAFVALAQESPLPTPGGLANTSGPGLPFDLAHKIDLLLTGGVLLVVVLAMGLVIWRRQ